MFNAGLLPIKELSRAKARLSEVLAASSRLALAEALFADALDLCEATSFLRWYVSDDDLVLQRARVRGFDAVRAKGVGLYHALALGIASALSEGARSVTVLPGDVPLARARDLSRILDLDTEQDIAAFLAHPSCGHRRAGRLLQKVAHLPAAG